MKMVLVIFIHVAYFILYGSAEDIMGGEVVQPHSMPYMAYVKIQPTGICGGILISDNYVLTAAHCAKGNMKVILGAHNIAAAEDFRQEIEVCNAIPFPKYKDNANYHDIMLLKLRKNAVLNRYILPMPISKIKNSVKPGSVCTVAGWGKCNTFNDKTSELLRKVDLKVVSTETCSTAYPDNDVKNFICAGEEKEKKTTGQGDSGSPLFCGAYLSGIVFGGRSDKKPPSLFTKISPYKSWIISTMKKGRCKIYT